MADTPKTAPKRPWYLPRSAGREQVADDRERDREDRAGADALDAPEEDQLSMLLAQAGQGRADEEDEMPMSSIGRRPKMSDSLP